MLAPVINRDSSKMYVESYANARLTDRVVAIQDRGRSRSRRYNTDRRRSSVVFLDDVDLSDNNLISIDHIDTKPKHRITKVYKSKKIPKTPIILARQSNVSLRSRYGDGKESQIALKKVRRKSESRQKTTIVPTINVKVEERAKEKEHKKKRATLVYKEPREEKIIATVPSYKRKSKLAYMVSDQGHNNGADVIKVSKTKMGRERRFRMKNSQNFQAIDNGIYEEVHSSAVYEI